MTPEALLTLAHNYPFVLGSGSPRRVQLLTEAGVTFRQVVSEVEETRRPGEAPFDFAVRMAEEKAVAVAATCKGNEIVLAGDTIVVLGKAILNKPVDRADAVRILTTLSGERHMVGTALALAIDHRLLTSGIETTEVFFNEVTRQQIEDYVDSGEPMDKAGAYGIQGMGAFLVDRIDGNLDNVVGLPLTLLNTLAETAGRRM